MLLSKHQFPHSNLPPAPYFNNFAQIQPYCPDSSYDEVVDSSTQKAGSSDHDMDDVKNRLNHFWNVIAPEVSAKASEGIELSERANPQNVAEHTEKICSHLLAVEKDHLPSP